jgi:hypothetical protein
MLRKFLLATTCLLALAATPTLADDKVSKSCQNARDAFARDWAEYDAKDKSQFMPGADENNEKQRERERANIAKGCAPGGFYDQMDNVIHPLAKQADKDITELLASPTPTVREQFDARYGKGEAAKFLKLDEEGRLVWKVELVKKYIKATNGDRQ